METKAYLSDNFLNGNYLSFYIVVPFVTPVYFSCFPMTMAVVVDLKKKFINSRCYDKFV